MKCNTVTFIDTQKDFQACLHTLTHSSSDFMACDTEFIRQKTFYPELCLIQCAVEEHAFLIDALAFDPSIFAPLFFSHTKTFVFHSSKQDLEILYHLYGKLPSSLFDSQIAGQFLGLGESIAYDGLVKHYLSLEIDKSQQHTNWKRRPLSLSQIDYAASDVIHLAAIYPKMIKDLEDKGYLVWALDEMKSLSDITPFETISTSKLTRFNISKNKYALALALLELREKHAKAMNINRMQCLMDKDIEAIVKIHSADELHDYLERTLPKVSSRNTFITDIIACVESEEHDTAPLPLKVSVAQQKQLEALRAFRDEKAETLGLPRTLLATSQDLKDFILTPHQGRIATTWRREVFEGFFQE